jgi:hypothetical protein
MTDMIIWRLEDMTGICATCEEQVIQHLIKVYKITGDNVYKMLH